LAAIHALNGAVGGIHNELRAAARKTRNSDGCNANKNKMRSHLYLLIAVAHQCAFVLNATRWKVVRCGAAGATSLHEKL
jgi:hypothetical protein